MGFTTVTLKNGQRLNVVVGGFRLVFVGDTAQDVTVSVPTYSVSHLRSAGVIV